MNVCTLLDQLKHAVEINGPFSEVVIATKDDQRTFNFKVNERTRLVGTSRLREEVSIITLEVTDEVSRYIVQMED
jgi:hypothetical protein